MFKMNKELEFRIFNIDNPNVIDIGFNGAYCGISLLFCFVCIKYLKKEKSFIAFSRLIITATFLLLSFSNYVHRFDILNYLCVFNMKFGLILFHFSMILSEMFQFYRIYAISIKKRLFLLLALILLMIRIITMIVDVKYSFARNIVDSSMTYDASTDSFVELKINVCSFHQNTYTGILYPVVDGFIELFITLEIIAIMTVHQKQIRKMSQNIKNFTVYKFVIHTSILRTSTMFLINIATLMMILLKIDYVWLSIVWSLQGISYLYFIILDKSMVHFFHKIAHVKYLTKNFYYKSRSSMRFNNFSSEALKTEFDDKQ